jgi:repressor LexA
MKKIEVKINEVYNYITDYVSTNGFPPSVREICTKLNIKSTATAYYYIEKLMARGLLEKSPSKNRAITIPKHATTFKAIPIVGTINAGSPIFAVENLDGYCPIPEELKTGGTEFALRVNGDSMINAGIYDKDIIIVKQQCDADNGQIVVALIDDSATVKRFYKKDNQIILHPENDAMEDMIFDDVMILGVVKGLIRKF